MAGQGRLFSAASREPESIEITGRGLSALADRGSPAHLLPVYS